MFDSFYQAKNELELTDEEKWRQDMILGPSLDVGRIAIILFYLGWSITECTKSIRATNLCMPR